MFVAAAVVLPYIAVVMANAVGSTAVEPPTPYVAVQPALMSLRSAFGKIAKEGGDPVKVLMNLQDALTNGKNPAKAMAEAMGLLGNRGGLELANAIKTGKFNLSDMLKTITGDGEVVLLSNPDYFKGKAHIDKFIAKPFADQNIMAQALMFNAVDMIVLVNPRNLPEVQGDKRFVLQPYNALSYSFFGYNVRNPLLADRRVRKAITAAINRQDMGQWAATQGIVTSRGGK